MSEQHLTLPGDPPLEARFQSVGRILAIIAPPHPLMGGTLDNPVVEALAEGFIASGISTLRFNYRGVQDSGGEPSGRLSDCVEDYSRAARWARAQDIDWLIFGGYSFGAVSAIHTHLGGLDCHAIAAVSPPTAMLTAEQMSKLDCLYSLCQGAQDSYIDRNKSSELLTHVPWGEYSLIAGADHFFAGQLDKVTAFASRLGGSLVTAHAAEAKH
jgi:hypothetical protein